MFFSLRNPDSRKHPPVAAIAIVAIVAALYIFPGAGNGSLENSDDGNVAWLIREMSEGRSLLDFSFQGGIEHSKTLLYHWLSVVPVKFLGDSELALRFVSCLAFVAFVLMVFLLAYQVSGRLEVAFVSAALGMALFLPMRVSRRVGEDTLLSAFLAAALYFQIRAERVPKEWIRWGIAAALALLTKGVVGAIAIAVAVLECLIRSRRGLTTKWPYWGLGLALLPLLAWNVLSFARRGTEYWGDFLGTHVLTRAWSPIHGTTSPFFYVTEFVRQDPVLSCAVGAGLVLLILAVRMRKLSGPTLLPLVLGVAVPFFLFSVSKTRFDRYMLPAYAPLIVLAACGVGAWVSRPRILLGLAIACLGAGIVFRQEDLWNPDYAAEMKSMAWVSRQELGEADSLWVYDVYYTAAAFYSQRKTYLVTTDPNYYRDLTESVSLLKRSGTVVYSDPSSLAATLMARTPFCVISSIDRADRVLEAIRSSRSKAGLKVFRSESLVLACVGKRMVG